MKGTGQIKVRKRGFDGQGITFAFVGKVLTREINVGPFAGGREEWHLANEETRISTQTGGFRLSGGVESWTSPTLVSVKFCFESRLGSTPIRDCEF
ncbi:hypothetical protein AVEN_24783-1 [Araneus ventricosus]|uniref:Uncharacterized protein n=1 Tax=Araneus ventricosus TaxID=182803 RepID=A0A4Y2JN53_ARAVE|nr:hypothetical protein AVEN_24783-1 [Araneus ventricosus]